MTRDTNRLAALYVAKHGGGTPADRRDLLDALGLLDGTGRGIVPTPGRDRTPDMADLSGPSSTAMVLGEREIVGRFQDDKRRPTDLSHVPAGLRDYVPPADVPAPRRRRGTSDARRNVLHDGRSVQPVVPVGEVS